MVKSPVVIPFITRMAQSVGDNKLILAMARFKGNHDAEAFVLEKLRSDDAEQILAALAVLQEWKYVLPEREVFRLLNLPSTLRNVREARAGAILYAATVPGDIFRTDVRGLVNDPDGYIAEIAQRVYPTERRDQPIK